MESGFQPSSKHANRGPRSALLCSSQLNVTLTMHAWPSNRLPPQFADQLLATSALTPDLSFRAITSSSCPRSLHIRNHLLLSRYSDDSQNPWSRTRACHIHAGSTAIFAMLFGSRAYRFPLLSQLYYCSAPGTPDTSVQEASGHACDFLHTRHEPEPHDASFEPPRLTDSFAARTCRS